MTTLSRNLLLCFILTVVIKTACPAADSTQHSNRQNSEDPVLKIRNPDSTEAAISQSSRLSIAQQSSFPADYRYSERNATQSVVYDLLQLKNKYYPKIKDLIRHVQGFEKAASRVRENSPGLNHIAERVTDVKAAIGFILSIPLIVCCSAFFFNLLALGGIVIGFNGWDLGTLGRRRMLRDLSATNNRSHIFDFDQGLSSDQTVDLALLVARVDSLLTNYTLSFEGDTRSSTLLNRLDN